MNTKFQKAVDKYAGPLICACLSILRLFSRKKSEREIKKILVVRLWALGETILTLPMIHAIRKKYPKAEISVLVHKRNRDVFEFAKDIDCIVEFGLSNIFKFRKYDIAIDTEPWLNVSAILGFWMSKWTIGFSGRARALVYSEKVKYADREHSVINFLNLSRKIGAEYYPKSLVKLDAPKNDLERTRKMLRDKKIQNPIGIAPGVGEYAKSRIWPPEKYAELCDEIVEKLGRKIIFVGSRSDSEAVREIMSRMKYRNYTYDFSGKTNFRQLMSTISFCSVFISNDTGPMHLAAAQGVKTIGLFGPNLPQRFGPFGKHNVSIYHKVECSPCINVHLGKVPECIYFGTKDYQKCMKRIQVSEVFDAVKNALPQKTLK